MTRREGRPPLPRARNCGEKPDGPRNPQAPNTVSSTAKFDDLEEKLDSLWANYTLKCKQDPYPTPRWLTSNLWTAYSLLEARILTKHLGFKLIYSILTALPTRALAI